MLYSDIREAKVVLDIDPNDTSEDKKVLFFIEWSSKWIGELLGRPDFSLKFRTQYYKGTGTQKLLLRNRPVFQTPAPIVTINSDAGFFGALSGAAFTSTNALSLTYGADFTVSWDQDDGTSRSAILYRINNLWPKPSIRQTGYLSPFIGDDTGSIQVQYQAGWTVDTLPSSFRFATNLLVSRMRYVFPLGLFLSNESYEERNISTLLEKKDYLLTGIKDLIHPYRNWAF